MNGIATRNSSSWLLKKPQICGRLIIASPSRIGRLLSVRIFPVKLTLSSVASIETVLFITGSDAFSDSASQTRLAKTPDRRPTLHILGLPPQEPSESETCISTSLSTSISFRRSALIGYQE